MSAAHPIDRIWPFFAPLSRAMAPLRVGLGRRQLQRTGVELREVAIHGTRLNYYTRRGTGAPLLLIHGLGDSAMTWAPMFGLLPNHRLYAIDLPGYGLSGLPPGRTFSTIEQMRDMLAVFVREVIGQPAVVVGNSMGGWLAVELGLAVPEQIHHLVLINPGGALLGGEPSYIEFRELLGAQDLGSARLVLRRMYGAVPRPLLYLSQSALQDVFQRRVVRDFIAQLEEREFLQEDDLRRLAVPTTLLWGQTDEFLPRGSFEFFRENLPDAETHVLAGVGHIPQVERPREVAAIIERVASRVAL